ncbi:hypothetical protein NKR23_g1873 [Pleurostoma richardsiae]|uniref:Uncharacterized protein n=1 Tax=Pleurostoma richardsiae TaxID=41990 RepID=A0AA38S940_9PEZI|nr:hypothetical protein NKR23_g1873 [Pleurostoma richardsiae]
MGRSRVLSIQRVVAETNCQNRYATECSNKLRTRVANRLKQIVPFDTGAGSGSFSISAAIDTVAEVTWASENSPLLTFNINTTTAASGTLWD